MPLLLASLVVLLLSATVLRELPFIQVWVPPWAWREHSHLIMLGACVLIAAGAFRQAWLQVHLREPAALGVLLVGAAHLISNGDLVTILTFGALSTVAIQHMVPRINLRRATRRRASVVSDIAAILLGSTAWIMLYIFHGPLFGVAVTPL